jgi:hypothetical protein
VAVEVTREPVRLWHFTCADSRDKIDAAGVLIPNAHPWFPVPLVWLTDLEDAPAEVLFGYPTGQLVCDRSQYRYEVEDVSLAVPWHRYARGLHRTVRERAESVPGSMPAHWWVSDRPVPVLASAFAVHL